MEGNDKMNEALRALVESPFSDPVGQSGIAAFALTWALIDALVEKGVLTTADRETIATHAVKALRQIPGAKPAWRAPALIEKQLKDRLR